MTIASKIYTTLDNSHSFWDIFRVRKEQKRKKKLGTIKLNISATPFVLTMAVNPKEYFELFEDRSINKNHKGIKKGSSGLGLENFSQKLNH